MQVLSETTSSFISFEDFQSSIAGKESAKVAMAECKVLFRDFLSGLTPADQPVLLIFAGGSGSGKTTYRKQHFANFKNAYVHDMDDVLVRLDGYCKDLKEFGPKQAFENWWPTAQKLANQLVQYAIKHRLNVIYDRTCGTQQSFADLQYAVQQKGYKANMYAFWVPEQEAINRVQQRAKVEGRIVTDALIIEYARRFAGLFERYLAFIDTVHLFARDKEIFVKEGHVLHILDPEAYGQFLQCKLKS